MVGHQLDDEPNLYIGNGCFSPFPSILNWWALGFQVELDFPLKKGSIWFLKWGYKRDPRSIWLLKHQAPVLRKQKKHVAGQFDCDGEVRKRNEKVWIIYIYIPIFFINTISFFLNKQYLLV